MEDLNLIRKVAWDVHSITGFEFEELFSEASLKYCELRWLKGDKAGKFSVFAYKSMKNHLISFVMKEKQMKDFFVRMDDLLLDAGMAEMEVDEGIDAAIETKMQYEYQFESLEADLQVIADLILNDPKAEYDNIPPKCARGLLRQQLRKLGWVYPRINSALQKFNSQIDVICNHIFFETLSTQ